jgi:hypothetical protein
MTDADRTGTRAELGALFGEMAARTCPQHAADLHRRLLRLSATADDLPAHLCEEFYAFVPHKAEFIFEMLAEISAGQWKPATCADVVLEIVTTLRRLPDAN